MLYIILLIGFCPLVWMLFRPKITNWSGLNVKGKAIFVSNHCSLADPILIAFVSPRIIHFMAKKELFGSPVFAAVLKLLFAFPVDRGHADLQSMKMAKAVLDKGKVFGIFPEGKRSITGDLDEFKKGAAFLALRCDAPVIPIYSDPNTFRKMRIRMIVGEPICPKEASKRHPGKSVDVLTEVIRDELLSLKNQMEAAD